MASSKNPEVRTISREDSAPLCPQPRKGEVVMQTAKNDDVLLDKYINAITVSRNERKMKVSFSDGSESTFEPADIDRLYGEGKISEHNCRWLTTPMTVLR